MIFRLVLISKLMKELLLIKCLRRGGFIRVSAKLGNSSKSGENQGNRLCLKMSGRIRETDCLCFLNHSIFYYM